MRAVVVPLLAGVLFAVGLVIGGMTQPAKVIGFLDFGGAWDPSLAFVMGGAVLVYAPLYRLIIKRSAPLLAAQFLLPTRVQLDGGLIIGALLFGVGWGLVGFCPGPALAALGSGLGDAVIFVAAMLAGMLVYRVALQPRLVQ